MSQSPTDPRRRYWQAHITTVNKSGLSRAEYCRQQKLSYHALTYWHRKLSRSSSPATTLVPVPIEQLLHDPVQAKGSGLKIFVTDKLSIEVDNHFSPSTLSRVLSVLENR